MKKIIILISIFLTSLTLFAQNANLGTSGAQFLQIPVSARAEALGNAIVGLADDAGSIFYNPAGIVKVKNVEVFFSYANWFDLFDINAVSLVYNSGSLGAFGASAIIFSTDKMEITTEENPNGTGRYFDAGDLALGLSYARYLTDKFSVGLTVKYINQKIWNESANGVAFDFGTQYLIDFQNLTIAMSMTNFGGDMQFDGPDLDIVYLKDPNFPLSRLTPARLKTDQYPLPLHFQVGIGFDIYKTEFMKIRGDIDASHPNDNTERVHFGSEISFFDRLYIRGGYKLNYDDQKFSFGAGANVPFSSTFVYFDYSYSIYDLLPGVHRISVKMSF